MTTPAWPGVAGLPALPSRAQWQRASIQLPFASENGEVSAPEILWGSAIPNGLVSGDPGDLYMQTAGGGRVVWEKRVGAGTVTGWYRSRIGFYDPMDYGAVGDLVADDAAAVQAAVSAIPAAGGVLYCSSASAGYLLGATIVVPTDRLVVFEGEADFMTNSGGMIAAGAVFRRKASFTSGALISQASPTPVVAARGMQMRGVTLDGNNVAGDLLNLDRVQNVRLTRVSFFNGNGNGLLMTTVFNWFVDQCRFFELGNTTAYPNGKSAFAMLASADGGTGQGWITQPHFEAGRGSYLTSFDATGTHPNFGICIIGGKMEWSGNAATGFAPAAANALGVPFAISGNSIDWVVVGMTTVNGFHTAATHWLLTNTAGIHLDVMCVVTTGLADNQNPRFLVDLFSGSQMSVRGSFKGGASTSGGAGAQIRVVESSVTGYVISPTCTFTSPVNGVAIVYTNPTTGKASAHRVNGAIYEKLFLVSPAIATQVCNALDGDHQEFNITSNIAVVVQAPTNPPPTGQTQDLTVTFFNNSGGALGTAPTFAGGAGAFLLSAAVVNPGNGLGVSYTFRWSKQAGLYREISRTVAF